MRDPVSAQSRFPPINFQHPAGGLTPIHTSAAAAGRGAEDRPRAAEAVSDALARHARRPWTDSRLGSPGGAFRRRAWELGDLETNPLERVTLMGCRNSLLASQRSFDVKKKIMNISTHTRTFQG